MDERPLGSSGWVARIESEAEDAVWREIWTENVYRLGADQLAGTVVLDLGSNIGLFTAFALAHGAVGVVAVEPVAEHQARARAMLDADERVVWVTAAAGSGDAVRLGPGSGPEQTVVGGTAGVEVPGISLAMLVDLAGRWAPGAPIVAKVDTEGSEYSLVGTADRECLAALSLIAMEWHGAMGALRRSAVGRIGGLVERLLGTHSVTVYGDPEVGGMLHAYRY